MQKKEQIINQLEQNKLIPQKSICFTCGAKRSVFVKNHKPDKKKKVQITKHACLL